MAARRPPRAAAQSRPVPAGLDAAGFHVVIFTTRHAPEAHGWLETRGPLASVPVVADRTPAAHAFVDDRAACFRGNFDCTLADVIVFRAYWEETPPDA